MGLSEKQRLFCSLVGILISWAYANGYELTFGEATRSDEQAEINALGDDGRRRLVELLNKFGLFYRLAQCIGNNAGSGIRNTLHELRLAVDLNLWVNGKYITDSAQYLKLGEKWESLHPDCRWGGRFKPRADGNHFSLTHEGKQ